MQDYIHFKRCRERYYSNFYAKRCGHLKMESNYSSDNIPEIALSWVSLGEPVVLATVVETWGSAPRRVGAQMAIGLNGKMQGSVSGGCIENAVVSEAEETINTKKIRLLEYGVSNENAFSVGLACGGKIRVMLEPVGHSISIETLKRLVELRRNKVPVACVVDINTGKTELKTDSFSQRLISGLSGFEEEDKVFVTVHSSPIRIVIVGAVHIAQNLVKLSRIANFDPIVIDPRSGFANSDRFDLENIIEEWPDTALSELSIDRNTAIVLLTHDPKLDDPALEIALNSNAFYIGALGSKKTHAARKDRMEKLGFDPESTKRISGPIGLNIGASNPAEIAVSILAEIISKLRQHKE